MHKWLCLGLTACFSVGSFGQTVAPARPTSMVIVPALVEDKSGHIAFDLSATDFSLKDNGFEQQVILEDNDNLQPLSLLLVIQTGGSAATQLSKIEGLNDLLDSILTSPQDQVALLPFDNRPSVVQDFTTNSDKISHALSSVAPGNAGATLFDALHMALTELDKASPANRRVVLLISGEHDHGSNASDSASLIRGFASGDISVYSLTFAAPRKELLNRLRSLNPLAFTASSMQKNAAATLAQLTGGDFYRFDTDKNFEEHVSEIADHIHNRYSLAFQPHSLEPGFHTLQVDVHRSKTIVVSARSAYWLSTANVSQSGGSALR
jgi:VWFA-related protein